jgi:hypothetical protein
MSILVLACLGDVCEIVDWYHLTHSYRTKISERMTYSLFFSAWSYNVSFTNMLLQKLYLTKKNKLYCTHTINRARVKQPVIRNCRYCTIHRRSSSQPAFEYYFQPHHGYVLLCSRVKLAIPRRISRSSLLINLSNIFSRSSLVNNCST